MPDEVKFMFGVITVLLCCFLVGTPVWTQTQNDVATFIAVLAAFISSVLSIGVGLALAGRK